ncbi:hypothetical protein LA5095_05589 [Roseibium album]|uniref:Uncharacterized protein n=1 Tax=Roseibium album TaxID=311410 RepID=A0A0M7AYJ0_9HYPH|nr:hypothetical protein LA5094_05456 [Roseibium album]CTQ78960.1 hypothetical protein LA5096_05943 [Roseibium album]CTQ80355.1 hypothetical protein LA5095_05589 [Roseibium album]
MLQPLKVVGVAPNPLQAGDVYPNLHRVNKCFFTGTPISMWDGME